jgi:hypothetical protein
MGYKRGFKVVTQDLLSSNVTQYAIKYKLNKWVFPKPQCGPLTIFRTIESAENWSRHCTLKYHKPFLIFDCRYRPGRQIEPAVFRPGRRLSFKFLPADTDLAARVMLLSISKDRKEYL